MLLGSLERGLTWGLWWRMADTDTSEEDLQHNAEVLYGMIHARYIITIHGLETMVSGGLHRGRVEACVLLLEVSHAAAAAAALCPVQSQKYDRKDFGECPRTLCRGQPVLPVRIGAGVSGTHGIVFDRAAVSVVVLTGSGWHQG